MENIQEGVLKDIIDVFSDKTERENMMNYFKNRKEKSIKSISSAAKNYTLVFPLATSKAISAPTAIMISKAMESKQAQMLEILFAAHQLSDANTPEQYLSKFHKNIDASTISADNIASILGEAVEDMKRKGIIEKGSEFVFSEAEADIFLKDNMLRDTTVLAPSLSENSVLDFYLVNDRINHTPGKRASLVEAAKAPSKTAGKTLTYNQFKKDRESVKNSQFDKDLKLAQTRFEADKFSHQVNKDKFGGGFEREKFDYQKYIDRDGKGFDREKLNYQKSIDQSGKGFDREKFEYQKSEDKLNRNSKESEFAYKQDLDAQKLGIDVAKFNAGQASDALKQGREIASNILQSSDVKKANEIVGTKLLVTFYMKKDSDSQSIPISFLVAVKSRIYPIDSMDVINRIIAKNKDRNVVNSLLRATTGEISFTRDLIMGVDKAKLDAISTSKRGDSNKLWKVLERRGTKSKALRTAGFKNDAMSITTLVMTQEEVEYIKKYQRIDMEDGSTAKGIMESLNFMAIVIVDETNEVAKFLFDTGEGYFEPVSFNGLEREGNDTSTKKIIGLMAKMNR